MKDNVLDQIQNVRDWLDRAESDYQDDQYWQGELNLNLAQAELKKAWEESRRLHGEDKVVPLPSVKCAADDSARAVKARTRVENRSRFTALGRYRFGLVAAVVLLIFMSLTPVLNHTFLNQYRQASGDGSDLHKPATTEMVALGQVQADRQVIQSTEVATSIQTNGQVRRTTPTNRRAYNQVHLQFNVPKESLVSTSEKGVKDEVMEIPQPRIELASQVALESKNIHVLGKNKMFNTVSQVKYSGQSSTTKVERRHYDLDSLIELAKETLYH